MVDTRLFARGGQRQLAMGVKVRTRYAFVDHLNVVIYNVFELNERESGPLPEYGIPEYGIL